MATATSMVTDDRPTRIAGDRRAEHSAANCPGHPPGEHDQRSIEHVLEVLQLTPGWKRLDRGASIRQRLRGARRLLNWLDSWPGQGWQQRWIAARADHGLAWIDQLAAEDPRGVAAVRHDVLAGLNWLLLARVIAPGYELFRHTKTYTVFDLAPQIISAALFDQLGCGPSQTLAVPGAPLSCAELTAARVNLVKLVLHTGKDLGQIRPEDVLELRSWALASGAARKGLSTTWDLLVRAGALAEGSTLRAALRAGQRPIAELVDSYGIRSGEVRQVLIRYFTERRPELDYNSLRSMISHVAGRFWADIEAHHPGINSLDLPEDIALAWKERLQHIDGRHRGARRRHTYFEVLIKVRAFYLDIAEWAHTDPSWVPYAVASPVRRGDTHGVAKARQQTTARMHQRTRERLPQLPVLVDTADQYRRAQADRLAAAAAADIGALFTHADCTYRRVIGKQQAKGQRYYGLHVLAEDVATGERLDLTTAEDEAFWSWAVIETLRHTGVRLEELLEITHLGLVSHRLPTGEVVPLLQIVPSKSNHERLLLVSPELASVLASIISRLRAGNNGTIPLVARYDPHERTTGPRLPHLFQRRPNGSLPAVPSYSTVRRLLGEAVTRTGLRDPAGQPLITTAHDFRRMFTTEAVNSGLPIHIAARLLGHQSVNTTQGYHAVFDADLIRSYRQFLDTRRSLRPAAEYRDPTEAEWREFEQHFEKRKLELGTCGRPYGNPCSHEHACLRCPMLRVDPRQRARLVEIIRNLTDRISEARHRGWDGEVEGLQISKRAAAAKLAALDRTLRNVSNTSVELGLPLRANPSIPRAEERP